MVKIAAQQSVLPTQSLAWDHDQVVAELVDHFEINIDGNGYVDVGLVSIVTGIGADSWTTPLPVLVTGLHSVVVRACNPNGCSLDTEPFNFTMVAGVPTPVIDGSVRIIDSPP